MDDEEYNSTLEQRLFEYGRKDRRVLDKMKIAVTNATFNSSHCFLSRIAATHVVSGSAPLCVITQFEKDYNPVFEWTP